MLEQVGPSQSRDTLRTHVQQLRRKLGDGPPHPRLLTEPGSATGWAWTTEDGHHWWWHVGRDCSGTFHARGRLGDGGGQRAGPRIDGASSQAVATSISRLVTSGELAPVPACRPSGLAKALGVSPTTVNQAWQTLGRAGVLETRGRNGTDVRPEPGRRGPSATGA